MLLKKYKKIVNKSLRYKKMEKKYLKNNKNIKAMCVYEKKELALNFSLNAK